MSGPKGYQVQVSAAERRAREAEALRSRCSALLTQLELRRAHLRELGTTTPARHTPAVPAGPEVEQLHLVVTDLERALAESDAAIEERGRHLRRERLRSLIDTAGSDPLPVQEPTRTTTAAPRPRHREVLRLDLDKSLDRLAAVEGAPRPPLEDQARHAAQLLDGPDLAAAERALAELSRSIDQAARLGRAEAAVRTKATWLACEAADLEGADALALQADLRSCASAQDLARLHQAYLALRERERARRERRYVIDQTREALRSLGYEVGADFGAVALDGDAVVARRADLPDHGVQLRFLPGAPRVMTRVVAFGPTSPERDTEVERVTCGDLDAVEHFWARHGVDAARYHWDRPGQVPVLRVRAAASRPAATRGQQGTA